MSILNCKMSKKQDKTREHKLKPQYNPLISSLKNFVLAYEQGIKEERERILKIIDDMPVDKRHICGTYGIHIIPKGCSGIVTEWERIDKQDLKHKIKGDEK